MIMETGSKSNMKLGGFVIAGVVVLMSALYFIGKNQNSWASGLEVRIRFSDLNGLMEGDNVFYAGMHAGSVESTYIRNDTTIEVKLLINKKTSPYISRNAIASIGSDGLIGDKVVNIRPGTGTALPIRNGDLLVSQEVFRFDKMLPKMVKIGDNVAMVSEVLKKIVTELDSSQLLAILKDRTTARQLHQSLNNLDQTTHNAAVASGDIRAMTAGIRNGKGSVGRLLRDTQIVKNLIALSGNMKAATDTISRLSARLGYKIDHGNGPLNMFLTDTAAANNLRAALVNIRLGTGNFNQNMIALQHNFLLRGFFKNKEKERQKLLKTKVK
jgi:phospholipid/cholesterol/gamma-HCH transport system substrate-binding protein